MQYLIREFTDSTGHVHVNVEAPRENERMTLVEADTKEEAVIKRLKSIKLPKITTKEKIKGIVNRIVKTIIQRKK
ncbi:DUF1381 domain-containing protein [Staphylococcus haemolyticus]|uniref:DUF1381 domain-containing protein n=1 Tax=Staphylococcus haemolyticus (strain JCSC1435) TaxID=279808 RepID=Q4L5I1_STAHJ|nr:DUF1381 domain-containing protein [Staphylococcus haemolyticus]BAE05094.1 unnamed protein product [Staphylococcus haemolyticus JCSC1435]